MSNMNNRIKLSIPCLCRDHILALNLIELMSLNPECFRENIDIDSVYGCFPCIWNGETINNGNFNFEDVEAAVKAFNKSGIKVRFMFNNTLLSKEQLEDAISNGILKTTVNNQIIKNEVCVASESLKNFIEKEYPQLQVVLDRRKAPYEKTLVKEGYNKNYLNKIGTWTFDDETLFSDADLNRCLEISVNEPGISNYLVENNFYEGVCRINMKEFAEVKFHESQIESFTNYYKYLKVRKHYISYEKAVEKWLPLGVEHFCIEGNNYPTYYLLESLIDFLVKPESRDEMRYVLLETIQYR